MQGAGKTGPTCCTEEKQSKMASLQFAGDGATAGGGVPEGRFGSAEAGRKAAEAVLRTACPSGAPAARKFSENTGLLRL